ncbi:MAG TPA: hypothetical protein VG672_16070 [Bryobacteraceae bacterium]|nr:hypothetical protein [Bryobacteraceae bacterium]
MPANDVHCVAALPSAVYAGTPKGLAAFTGGAWHPLNDFSAAAVDVCLAAGEDVYFTYAGSLHRLRRGSVERLAPVPAGEPRDLAVRGPHLFLATARSLFALERSRLVSVPLPQPQIEIRQIAVDASGNLALAAEEGLFLRDAAGHWAAEYPRESHRSWAPRDLRAVAYDAGNRLWFAGPQGAGRRDPGGWKLFTGFDGLPYDDFTSMACGEPGVVWFATHRGAIRFDGATWEYRQGLRWLPSDEVRAISVTPGGDAWFATPGGAGLIERKPMTLAEKAKFFEDEIDRRHRRTEYGYIMAVHLPKAGDKTTWVQHDSDNDGLWTSMYGAGECFAYAATRDPLARERARKAFEALRFLSQVTQGGEHPAPPGFPARAVLPTSGPDPNLHDSRERDLLTRATRDHLWKILAPRWPKSADGKWFWKTDTSSDELDGHFFFYAQYYDLVAATPQEKEDVRAVVRAIADHLLDHNYSLVDWDGKVTRWAFFDPASLNDNPDHWAERGLNSLSILSYLKVAGHITGDRKYRQAYDRLVREHKYATNVMVPKISVGPGSGNQSDDEMAFMSFYNLLKYETDGELLQKYGYALANYWAIERLELNPFFNFLAAASLTGKKFTDAYRTYDLTPTGNWLEESIETLRRLPLDRIDWRHTNSHRKDIVHLRAYVAEDEEMAGSGYRRNGKVLPVDERFFEFWNHNPYRLDSGGSGHTLADGAVFLLPYYMGLYHRYIQ